MLFSEVPTLSKNKLSVQLVPNLKIALEITRLLVFKSARAMRLILRRSLSQKAATEYTLDIVATQIIAEKREGKIPFEGKVEKMWKN